MKRSSTLCALIWAMSGLVLIAGCGQTIQQDVENGLAAGKVRAAQQQARLEAARRGHVIEEALPYFGRQVEKKPGSRQGKPLPKKFEGARGIALAIEGKADIRAIADAITAATDIPISIRTRYIRPDGSVIAVPIGTRIKASYEGPLSAFLDRLSARMDIAWTYDGRSIAIDRMTTTEWKVPLPRGKASFSDSLSDSGDIQSSQGGTSIETSYDLDPWAELQDRLAPLAPAPAHISYSKTASRVQVFGPPSVQRAVARVLEDVVALASKRIALEVAVFFVDSDRAEEFGLTLQSDGANLGSIDGKPIRAVAELAANLAAPGSTVTLTRGLGSVSLETLARDDAVVDYRIGSTTVQSGVIAPISLSRTQSYNRYAPRRFRRQTDEDGDSETEEARGGLETASFKTGIIIAALPRLVDRGQLQLGLAITQRDLVRIDSNGFPVIDERAIRSEAVLSGGETLVVSGYEQQRSERKESGVGILRKVGLGGRNAAENRRVRMYVLIRPSILAAGRRS